MKRWSFLLLALLVSCSKTPANSPHALSSEPVSVRGWIHDAEGSVHEQIPDLEIARRQQLFIATTVFVEKSEFSSGGVAENGAFIVLDVPPHAADLVFQSTNIDAARLVLKDVPGNADVLVPAIILRQGAVTVLDPKAIKVRVPGDDDQPRNTGKFATVASYKVPIIETPLSQLANRREYPDPGGFRPVATFR
jgi:hypothetical protein